MCPSASHFDVESTLAEKSMKRCTDYAAKCSPDTIQSGDFSKRTESFLDVNLALYQSQNSQKSRSLRLLSDLGSIDDNNPTLKGISTVVFPTLF